MKKTSAVPDPIRNRMIQFLLCMAGILLCGIIWSIVSSDRTLLLLTGILAASGVFKVLLLYRNAKQQHYDVYEGVVISDRRLPFQNRHELTLIGADHQEYRLILEGKNTLTAGKPYILYLQKSAAEVNPVRPPDSLKIAGTLLGVEEQQAE